MEKVNMFSAHKVKLHGMTSALWTTKDKITQYKGLINLYSRDRKILDVDNSVNKRKQYLECITMQKAVKKDRMDLDNAIRGDKQQLRNILAAHKELQLAYQNSQPKKVIENIHHVNFKKRKELDRLKYTLQMHSKILIDFKLDKSILEDRSSLAHGELPIEKQAQIVAGRVQDAILKKEAALAIKQTYIQMINIMKKDALYFDAVLLTITSDGLSQNKALINGTKLGQLATEYLDDRRQEYRKLEGIVIKDMQTRRTDLDVIQQQVEDTSNNMKYMLRRDSDVNTCMVKLADTPSTDVLKEDITKIEAMLESLKEVTMVPSFEHIYPCLQEQMRQRERLTDFAEKGEQQRDVMLNKTNHAELMRNLLSNTMVETTMEFKENKAKLDGEIAEQVERKRLLDQLVEHRHLLTAKVRISLAQLKQLCSNVRMPGDKSTKQKTTGLITDVKVELPPPEEIDGCKLIPEIHSRLEHLTKVVSERLEGAKVDEAFRFYEIMMKDRTHIKSRMKDITQESLLEGLTVEVSHILTRDDIKKQSEQIVEANSKDEDLVPVFVVKRKRWKFK